MFARLTAYKMRRGSKDEATQMMNALRAQIMAMPGMIQFTNIMNGDGRGYILTLVESEAQSDANAAKVAALWANFAPFMEAVPTAEGFQVEAHWTAPTG